jgi:putative hydrolase of the HAD superfamily
MIDWDQIDTVLLDMDGTLLDLHFDNYFWLEHLPLRYGEAHNVDPERAKLEIHEKIRELEGTLEWYCLDHWSELMQLDIPALKKEIKNKIRIRPHTETFLKRLQALNKKLVLITNSHPKGLQLKLQVTEIDRWLDIIISSHDFKTPKEEADFWQQLYLVEPFEKSRTLFIDDTPRILRSARDFGVQHLICVTLPDLKLAAKDSEEFIGICHFDEIMPNVHAENSCKTNH